MQNMELQRVQSQLNERKEQYKSELIKQQVDIQKQLKEQKQLTGKIIVSI